MTPGEGPGASSPPPQLQPSTDKEPLSLLGAGAGLRARLGSLRPQSGPAPPATQVPSVPSSARRPLRLEARRPPTRPRGSRSSRSLSRLLSRPSWSPWRAQGHGASPPAPAPGGSRPATRPGAGTPPGPRALGGAAVTCRGARSWARRSPPDPHLGPWSLAAWGGGGAGDCGAPGPRAPSASTVAFKEPPASECNALPASLPPPPPPAVTTQRPGPPLGHSAPSRSGGRRGSARGSPPAVSLGKRELQPGAASASSSPEALSHRSGGGGDHCRPRDADMDVLDSKYIPVMLPL